MATVLVHNDMIGISEDKLFRLVSLMKWLNGPTLLGTSGSFKRSGLISGIQNQRLEFIDFRRPILSLHPSRLVLSHLLLHD